MFGGRNFNLLWLAAVTSALGNGVRWIALPLLAAGQSRDPWTISLVTAAEQVPWLLFGLAAGALADRHDRRALVRRSDLARAAAVAAFAVAVAAGATPIALIAALGFVLTCGETVTSAATAALLPAVVPPPRRATANGHLMAGVQLTDALIGPSAGAALFGLAAFAPFAIDAVTFVASALCITLLRVPADPAGVPEAQASALLRVPADPAGVPEAQASALLRVPADPAAPAGVPEARASVLDGLRHLGSSRALLALCLLQAATTLAYTGILAVLVLFAGQVLGLGPTGFGLLVGAFAVGGVAGGLGAGALARWLGARRGMVIAYAAGALGVAAFGLASGPVSGGLLAAALGLASTSGNAVAAAIRQELVPDAYLGRVTSAFRLVGLGAAPLGALAAGALAHAYGLRAPFLAGGALSAAGLLLYAFMTVKSSRYTLVSLAAKPSVPEEGRAPLSSE
ncbi:MFS transporter [Dactylosporangium salmoneum]|uniref:Major facilitator superfamily (MFS) profile domain-containing protein n=1 Tax=Dactylosporangium salmoneum TaxID=53361 RepID=A0ABN3GYQ4_9ACTN